MATTATTAADRRRPDRPGRDSAARSGRKRSTSATSSSRTTRRTTATSRSSRRRPTRTKKIWEQLNDAVRRGAQEGRARRLADSRVRSPRTRPATSTGTTRSSSACRPTRRSSAPSCPTAASAWSLNALKTYGYEPDPHVVETFTKYRKTHNEGVFDAYTADIRALPQFARPHRPARRLRPRPDHRRLPARGALRRRPADRAQAGGESWRSTRRCPPRRSSATARNSAEQIRALKELKQMAASYGFDISGPARTAREAVQWLYFGYLAAVKEQNGAAMSLGRTSTFLDIYFERDLQAGTLTEEQAQEIIDDFVIKLRIVRFLRTPEYDELFAGDPTWVTESIGGMGDDGRSLVTKTSFRFLQTLYNLGPAPEPNLTIWYSPRTARRLPAVRRQGGDRHQLAFSSRATRSCAAPGATTAPIACCVSPMLVGKQMQFFGARANLAKCLLYAINGGRDEITGKQVGPATEPVAGRLPRLRRRARQVREDDGLAGRRLRQRHERHPLHARQVRLRAHRDGAARLRAAADHGVRHGRPVGGRRQPLGDQATRRCRSSATRPGSSPTIETEGEFPLFGNNDNRVDQLATWVVSTFMNKLRKYPTYRNALHTQSVLTITSNVVYGKAHRQHAGRPPPGRAVRAGRQPDARPRQPRHPRRRRRRWPRFRTATPPTASR